MTLQDYAVAIAYGLTIVEEERRWHVAMQQLGLGVEMLR